MGDIKPSDRVRRGSGRPNTTPSAGTGADCGDNKANGDDSETAVDEVAGGGTDGGTVLGTEMAGVEVIDSEEAAAVAAVGAELLPSLSFGGPLLRPKRVANLLHPDVALAGSLGDVRLPADDSDSDVGG